MKNFISVDDVSSIDGLVKSALSFKSNPYSHKHFGENKIIGLIFLNPSLRTRISTQVAAKNLGMEVIIFNADKEGWQMEFGDGTIMNGNTSEHIKEAAAVLGQYVDILGVRSFPTLSDKEKDYSEFVINSFIKYSGVPVISLESSTLHPLQSLADIITINEAWTRVGGSPFGGKGAERGIPKVVLTWAPHVKALPQAVPNSFAQWVNAWQGANFVIAHPEGYHLNENFTKGAIITHNQNEALEGADFVYVKNWSSYESYGQILSSDENWMITNKKMALTNSAKVMHCLPVRRNLVIADEVLDGSQSIVVQQAGNRVWASQAVLKELLVNS